MYEPILYGWPEGKKHHWCGQRNQADVWFFDKPQSIVRPRLSYPGLHGAILSTCIPR
jgi:hypothetical protein